MTARLESSREQVVAFRVRASGLDRRRPIDPDALAGAAVAGLSDSMPRAALLSLHARVGDIGPGVLDGPTLVQVWGPRFSAYAVAADDVPVFTVGRHPDSAAGRRRADDLAARLADVLGDDERPYGEVGPALGVHPNHLRYATTTGTVLIRWDGARQPTIRMVARPDMDPTDARLELARRHLRVSGPGTPETFGAWAGIRPPSATATFAALEPELVAVRTPIGDGFALAEDETALRSSPDPGAVRLLPSGDVLYLLWGRQRELLVPDADRRPLLWTPRVWPGAVLVGGDVVGTWRRSGMKVTIDRWQALDAGLMAAIESEASSLPVGDGISVDWT